VTLCDTNSDEQVNINCIKLGAYGIESQPQVKSALCKFHKIDLD